MDYCAPLGLPRSTFLAWDRDDRDAAIVWQMRRRATCQSCGTRAEEWDPELGGDLHAYLGEVRTCQGCVVQAATQKQIPDKDNAGAHVVLVRQEAR